MPPARALLIAACLLCTVLLSACGAKQDVIAAPSARPFSLSLDFFPNADHAAIYSAIAHGDFRAVGLDVRPFTPATPVAAAGAAGGGASGHGHLL